MKFEYRVAEAQPGYFDISLTAQEGPFNTKEHRFKFEAVPLDKDKTFIHLRHSFAYSSWEYYVMKMFGGSKPGFSVIGTDSDGNPVYTDGLRGGIERNAVCYHLAILAYLDTPRFLPVNDLRNESVSGMIWQLHTKDSFLK